MAVIRKLIFIVATFFVVCAPSVSAADVYPVILIPGDGGSQVEAKLNKTQVVHYVCEKTTSDFFSLWLNIELLVPVIIDCWVDNMKLIYNATTRTSSNAPGVQIRIPGWGNPSVVEWIDSSQASAGAYFNSVALQLIALNYTRNATLLGAPYDFRRGPREQEAFFSNMKLLVEEAYNRTGRAVVLMAHSMGGPMSALFLRKQSQAWKDKYVRALIALNGAWAGSVKALKVYAVGDSMGSYVLRESIMKEVQVTTSSLAWLLPSPYFWNTNEVVVQTAEKNYTLSDLEQIFTGLGYPDGWEMWKDTKEYVMDFSPPGVEVHCLHGAGVDTVERLIYKPKKFPSGYPSFSYGDGDGTVNLRSLESCTTWSGKQKQPIYHQVFSKVDHMGILHDPRVLSYIKSVLTVKL